MSRLVVVSNRVGVPDGSARAGGLEVAIRAALKKRGGLWFGWSGRVGENENEAKTVVQDNISYVTVDLRKADYDEFYNGFANRVLWPILHYRMDLAEFTRRDLGGYFRVNEHFARHLEKQLRPDDVIWVHDYHLIPFAKFLRERGHKNRIGFFIHIPFPPPEILIALPNHEQLIPSLDYYDLVGFQTETDASNCARYLTRECGLKRIGSERRFKVGDRVLEVGVFPVGVETEAFQKLARRAAVSPFVREVLSSLSGRAMIIGVDRLDYSKGIPERMQAFERFLTNYPDLRGQVTYLQITPRSRSDIQEYADIERMVGETVGRINGTFGEASWTPLRYINKAHSRTALAGLYRGARAALVTPLRDGMNLVAKEYVAAQNTEDPGVLILSRFAGAAHELGAALLVNPYDPEGVAMAINRALSMPLVERRQRQEQNYRVLVQNDITHWAERFLGTLEPAAEAADPPPARVAGSRR